MSRVLTRDAILGTPDAGRARVEVPEWGGYVWAHVMSGTERDAWEASIVREGGDHSINMRAKLFILATRDDGGNPLFTAADVEALGRKSYVTLDKVINKIQEINRLTNSSMEKLEGNSEPGRSEGQS